MYSGRLRLDGEGHEETLLAATNYATALLALGRYEEGKSLLRKTIPASQRTLGESNEITLGLRCNYALALYEDPDATLDDLSEAVTTLEDARRIARRVFGGTHPHTTGIDGALQNARAALRALSSKATEDACSRLREEIARLKAENAELRRHRINNNIS